MINPAEIREKAKRLYPQVIDAWLDGDDSHRYPWRIPANRKLADQHSQNINDVQELRLGAKESIGYGYSLEWEFRKSRRHGENNFVAGVFFDSRTDLLKLIGKQSEFKTLETRVQLIRTHLPELETWVRKYWSRLIDLSPLKELIEIVLYLKQNPRPGCYARELPLAIPTKLIQNHRALLTEWLDRVLPDETINCDCDPKHFEQRFGFRYFRQHVLVRVLDPTLQSELQLFTPELSLPPQAIAKLPIEQATVLIVENKITLLTLPSMERGISFLGMGMGVTQLFNIPWLRNQLIVYWGDLDVQGFQILAMLRRHYPHTKSILMDMSTLQGVCHFATEGTGHTPETPSELTASEAETFLYLRENNLRIEQEHIQQYYVDARFAKLVD